VDSITKVKNEMKIEITKLVDRMVRDGERVTRVEVKRFLKESFGLEVTKRLQEG